LGKEGLKAGIEAGNINITSGKVASLPFSFPSLLCQTPCPCSC
jgi:hypothetical protein